jgi:RimJ/RimL family protein N-acetyltransferase
MKDNFPSEIPSFIQTERLYLRSYQTSNEAWFYEVSQKNRTHLTKFESRNVVMEVHTREDARNIVHDLTVEWAARRSFFQCVFDKNTHEIVVQIYIGPLNWNLPEFELGYFADKDHQG